MNAYGMRLEPQHQQQLVDSGITPDHARLRGYCSVDTKVRLDQIGVTKAGRRVPGLLVPTLRRDGSTSGYQYRPDVPRLRDGKAVKYESPAGQRNSIDVPPGVGAHLDDPSVPLWITEGVKKADAAAVAGLCCIALPGVWSWRGTNDKGGRVAIADWHDIALNDRRVTLAFDGDVVRKRSVRAALDQLAAYLTTKGARVEYLHLPDGADKCGLDDFLVGGHTVDDLWKLVRPEPPAIVEPTETSSSNGAGSTGSAGSAGYPGTGAETGQGTGSTGSTGSAGYPETGRETGALLSEVREWIERFVCTVDETDLDLLTLWAAHTHLVVETYTTPRLILDSPVPGSGKTTVLEHFERLCLHPVQMASLSSPALLTRMLDAGLRTCLIDEADRSLAADRDGVGELLAVLNSGYKRGSTRPVLLSNGKGWEAKEMSTFAPVVMAGNNPNLPEDTKSRSIRVLLMPDITGEAEESDWELLDEEARELGHRLSTWADGVRDDVRSTRPELPPGIRGRARERWAPLKRVAVAAGDRWPGVVDDLAERDLERIESEREEGIMVQRPPIALLGHIHELWRDGEAFVATEQLIDRLVFHHPEMWGVESSYGKRLTPQRLGRMLVTSFNVHSGRLDTEGSRPRGYRRAALAPAFRRLGLDPVKQTGRTGSTGRTGPATDPDGDLSGKPAEPAEPVEPAPDRCQVCHKALAPGLIEAGYSTHPSCQATP